MSRRLARLLRAVLRPGHMSMEWLESQDRLERDEHHGPAIDWQTAPAAFAEYRRDQPADDVTR